MSPEFGDVVSGVEDILTSEARIQVPVSLLASQAEILRIEMQGIPLMYDRLTEEGIDIGEPEDVFYDGGVAPIHDDSMYMVLCRKFSELSEKRVEQDIDYDANAQVYITLNGDEVVFLIKNYHEKRKRLETKIMIDFANIPQGLRIFMAEQSLKSLGDAISAIQYSFEEAGGRLPDDLFDDRIK